MSTIYALSRLTLAIIFFYHGLVPKILYKSAQEIQMNEVLLPFIGRDLALTSTGVAEMAFGLLLLFFYQSRLITYLCLLFSILVSLALLIKLPQFYTLAFNPFSINLSLASLAVINLVSHKQKQTTLID